MAKETDLERPRQAEQASGNGVVQRQDWGDEPPAGILDHFSHATPATTLATKGRQMVQWVRNYGAFVGHSWQEVWPWLRSGLQHGQRPTRRALNALFSVLILGAMAVTIVGTAFSATSDYFALSHLKSDAISALSHVPDLLGFGTTLPHHYISTYEQTQAKNDIAQALSDMQQLHQRLATPDLILSAAMRAPRTAELLQSALLLSSVAIDGIQVLQQMFDTVLAIANIYVSAPLTSNGPSDQTQGGLTLQSLQDFHTDLVNASPYLTDLELRLKGSPPNVLFAALSSTDQAKILPYLQILPNITAFLPLLDQFMAAAPAILGVGQPASYLFITMDPAEMRATGGFQGNYTVMDMRAGRPGVLSLQDVYLLDKPYNATYPGDEDAPPAQYSSWWPYAPWGLRDANLSPDFLTSAQYDWQQLTQEKGNVVSIVNDAGKVSGTRPEPVTGMIAIEPAVIEQALQLTGPITIGAPYNDIVTAANFQQKIHYYQLTNQGRKLGTQAGQGDTLSSANKRFTALLARALEQQLKTMPKTRLLTLVGDLLNDLHTKDIQVAFTDPKAENFLRYYQVSSEMYAGNADSLMLADSNISGNKGSQYLAAQIDDQVQLDQYGGATHTMTINYTWDPPPIQDGTDPTQVYDVLYNANSSANFGLFYRQYTRIYTAQNPQVEAASGWQFGGMSTTVSDFPNRGMLGAYSIVQGDATTHPVTWTVPYVTVTWYVPNVYTPGGQYALHFQHQAGTQLSLNVTIMPPTCTKGETRRFNETPVTTDMIFTMQVPTC
jgi:hypothetical protein